MATDRRQQYQAWQSAVKTESEKDQSGKTQAVKTWAEKEMRNLKRLWVAGVPCPEPVLLRMHVLLMTFIGNSQGWWVFGVFFE